MVCQMTNDILNSAVARDVDVVSAFATAVISAFAATAIERNDVYLSLL